MCASPSTPESKVAPHLDAVAPAAPLLRAPPIPLPGTPVMDTPSPEARSGLAPFEKAELPSPPAPEGDGVDRGCRPGRHRARRLDRERRVSARARRIRAVRARAAVGDAGRGVPADGLQHGTHALDAGHRRTGGDGVHADAAVGTLLGLVLRHPLLPAGWVAGVGRRRGRGDLLPDLPGAGGARARAAALLDRRGHLRGLRGHPALRQTHRAHAGTPELGARGGDHRRFPDPGAGLRVGRYVG